MDDRNLALVRAYSDGYRHAGGDNPPETDEQVLDRLLEEDASTPEEAERVGQQDALREADAGGNPWG